MVLPWLITLVLVVLTVVIHYEALRLLGARIDSIRMPGRIRLRMALVMLAIIVTHIAEALLFAVGLYLAAGFAGIGELAGEIGAGTFGEYMYFSFVSYTTLGFGEIYPTAGLRVITGIEALTGLLMIAWSASFTYIYMEKFWHLGETTAPDAD